MIALRPLPEESRYARQLQRGFRKLRFEPDLEREYIRHLRADQWRPAIACGLLALVVWMGFAVADVVRLKMLGHAPHGSSGVWHIVAARWGAAAVLVGCILYGRRTHAAQRIHVLAYCSITALALAGAYSANLYELWKLPNGGVVQVVFVMAAFLPLGMSFYAAAALALLVCIYNVALSVVMLPDSLMSEHLCIGLMMLLTVMFTAIGGYFRERAHREQFLLRKILKSQALRDPLTGLHNRRSLDAHFEMARLQAKRAGLTVALAIADVDHFKKYNDCYGHDAGDEALKCIADCLSGFARRPLDRVFRIGGEEFAILLHDCSPERLRQYAERLCAEVRGLCIEHAASQTAPWLTISLGAVVGLDDETLREIYRRADALLYESKHGGRNRATVEEHPMPMDQQNLPGRQPD